jgi:hypothetical protein
VCDGESRTFLDLVPRYPIDGPGQRHTALKYLAIDIKQRTDSVSPVDSGSTHSHWWQMFGGFTSGKTSEDESLMEFERMLDEIRGDCSKKVALANYKSMQTPAWAAELSTSPSLGLVARALAAADRAGNGKEFPLPMRTIHEWTGVCERSVNDCIKRMLRRRYVKLVSRGTAGGSPTRRRANVYQMLVNEDGSRRGTE